MAIPSLSVAPGAALFARVHPSHRVAGITAFALLTALGALVRIPLPFTPVPITFQTFFVLMSGVYLGDRDGAASQLAYLGLGAAGLPVFAGGVGIAALWGPTGGFLVSFPIVAWLVGRTLQPGDTLARSAAVFFAATLVIFSLGTAWLTRAMGVEIDRAITLAVLPFLPGAILKALTATALVVRAPLRR